MLHICASMQPRGGGHQRHVGGSYLWAHQLAPLTAALHTVLISLRVARTETAFRAWPRNWLGRKATALPTAGAAAIIVAATILHDQSAHVWNAARAFTIGTVLCAALVQRSRGVRNLKYTFTGTQTLRWRSTLRSLVVFNQTLCPCVAVLA